MRFEFSSKHLHIHWQFLDRELQDSEGSRVIAGMYVRFNKWSRGRILRLSGDLSFASARYDILHDGKRTSWTVQSPVRCEKYGF